MPAAGCGDGVVNASANETCDAQGQSATCDIDCTQAVCGDSVTNAAAGELCDTGGESSTCDANCTLVVCGDGTVNVSAGETCEPPSVGTCDASCHTNIPD